ncbi:MAG TPA: hypothetical protein VJX67_07190, partial [Blastocatellia bacterium]|nr:hypothetical protein [Blastocatellia bacterium]
MATLAGTSAEVLTATTDARAGTRALPIPWFALAALFGSTSIIVGGQWDISWHMTIGRDTFWTPAHMAIYLGGVVAGVSSGWVVLKTTFRGTAAERAQGVRLWGFTGPLGAFFCIWGAFAMLTSAPFDNWWHNAYGLDTEILSPPHVVVALGIAAIQVGAMIVTVALQNRCQLHNDSASPDTRRQRTWLRIAYVYAAGMLLTNAGVMTWTFMERGLMHSSIYYQVGCGVLPLFLVGAARASGLRWPATATAAVYMGFCMAMMWILQLFPGEPKLGPVRQHVTHLVPLDFPILLVIPALAIDLLMRRFGLNRDWKLSVVLGIAFLVLLLAVQWPFGDFLMSPLSRNYFFATNRFGYYISSYSYRYR